MKGFAVSAHLIQYTDRLLDQFHFTIIQEHYVESLILLKQMLNWTFEEILTIRYNERISNKNKVQKLSKSEISQLKFWNFGDFYFYSKAMKKFQNFVEKFGKKNLEKNVKKYEKIVENLKKFCGFCSISSKKISFSIRNQFEIKTNSIAESIFPSNRKDRLCELMATPGLQLTDLLWHRHRNFLAKKFKICIIFGIFRNYFLLFFGLIFVLRIVWKTNDF